MKISKEQLRRIISEQVKIDQQDRKLEAVVLRAKELESLLESFIANLQAAISSGELHKLQQSEIDGQMWRIFDSLKRYKAQRAHLARSPESYAAAAEKAKVTRKENEEWLNSPEMKVMLDQLFAVRSKAGM